MRTVFSDLLFLFCGAILLGSLVIPGCWTTPTPTDPPVVTPPDEPDPTPPPVCNLDGLAQAVFDTTVRIRNRSGSGSGSIVADLGDRYEIETNYHVAGKNGTPNVVDIWVGGDLVASRPTSTANSWYQASKSKDIATLEIPKTDLGGPLAVVPTAPPGWSETIRPGDMVYMIGCSDARWPRARCGNVIKNENGLIWYDPESIPGDSGSGVYQQDQKTGAWYCVGRTAWAIQENGKWVGLAMTSDRVRDIREGRVADGWALPPGAVPIELLTNSDDCPECQALPDDAVRLDLLGPIGNTKTDAPIEQEIDADQPQPIETGVTAWTLRRSDDDTAAPRGVRMLHVSLTKNNPSRRKIRTLYELEEVL